LWGQSRLTDSEKDLESLPELLQVNLARGSHILLTPLQLVSSLPSSQSLSPSQRQRSGMQVPSARQWNSSPLHSTGGNAGHDTHTKKGLILRYSNSWKTLMSCYFSVNQTQNDQFSPNNDTNLSDLFSELNTYRMNSVVQFQTDDFNELDLF